LRLWLTEALLGVVADKVGAFSGLQRQKLDGLPMTFERSHLQFVQKREHLRNNFYELPKSVVSLLLIIHNLAII
jgi:hypothetical protein